MDLVKGLLCDQQGVAAIQYALVAGVLSLAVLTGSLALREPIMELYGGMTETANAALIGEPAVGPLPPKEGRAIN